MHICGRALDAEIEDRVASIAPQANIVGGEVVYAVSIDLVEHLPDLRWG